MAKAYPKSKVYGFDYHEQSIGMARATADREGVGDHVTFEVASAKAFPGNDYDFIAFFDCLHDMGDPTGVARYVGKAIAPDGTWMIVEPYAEDVTEANHNPIGRYITPYRPYCASLPHWLRKWAPRWAPRRASGACAR